MKGEYGVGTRRGRIHVSCASLSYRRSRSEIPHHLLRTRYFHLLQPAPNDIASLVLPDRHGWFRLAFLDEQIDEIFVVYLDVADLGDVRGRSSRLVDHVENGRNRSRGNSKSRRVAEVDMIRSVRSHRIRFAARRLSVRETGHVVSSEETEVYEVIFALLSIDDE